MAINVSIPKEITEYEEKIMFGLSFRKLITLIIAIILSIATYFFCTTLLGLSMDATSYIIIIESLPLMAFGFIKKDGLTFEEYAMLIIRHKFGNKKLPYENELTINVLPDKNITKKESKYAWIFKKNNNKNTKRRRKNEQKREAIIFTITKKDRKRKRKEARRAIKVARQEYRKAQRNYKKAAKESRRA